MGAPAIRLLDGDWYTDDPHRHFAWMRATAAVYRDDAGEVWGASEAPLRLRPSNFIVGVEEMPVVFTPRPARA